MTACENAHCNPADCDACIADALTGNDDHQQGDWELKGTLEQGIDEERSERWGL